MPSIAWVTGEITVLQSELTLISPNFYELNSDSFRKDVMTLHSAVPGQAWPVPFEHNDEVTIAGDTFVRQVIINSPRYFVTFENLQYRVRIVGSNNNIHEVATINQVSVQPSNSAGYLSGDRILDNLEGEMRSNPTTGEWELWTDVGTPDERMIRSGKLWQDYAKTIPYQGQGIEVREEPS